jgi:formylglycine-generating enzyme required for sulfatase activity
MPHAATMKSVLGAVAVVTLAFLPAAVPQTPASALAGKGWYGETMPPGLERGVTTGEYVWKKDKAIMVYVPPGPFTMGSDHGKEYERPAHKVTLDGFYIDKYEVSWRKWKASGLPYAKVPNVRESIVYPPDWGLRDAHPVVHVTWGDAKQYAAWSGKRLPTEAEWEKAARGTDGREFPWGNEPPTYKLAMYADHPLSLTSTAPATCCLEGASPYGAVNMAGNVWEWCEDTYHPTYYASSPAKNPVNTTKGREKILRGGAFQLDPPFLRTYHRYWLSDIDRISDIGFRTVVNGVAEDPKK